MLLEYQQKNLEKLQDALKKFDKISIVGKVNSGRAEVVSRLSQENNIIINVLPGKTPNQNYNDILNAVREIKKISKANHGLNIDISVAYKAIGISLGANSKDLFAIESELVKRVRKLSFHRNVIIVIKDPAEIDSGTQMVLKRILKQRLFSIFSKRIIQIEICGSNNEATGEIIYFDHLPKDETIFATTLRDLNLNPDIHLSHDIIDFIFKNADGDIALISRIVNDLNTQNIDPCFSTTDNNLTISDLINSRISSCEFENKLRNILTILSICDRYFTSLDLSFLLQEETNLIELYLDYGVDNMMLNNKDNQYQILFELIKKIFSTVTDNKKMEIYNQIIKMIRMYYPDNYYEQYSFARLANNNNASTYLLQDIMRKIRLTGEYNYKCYEDNLSVAELDIMNSYYIAYYKSYNNMYNEAIEVIETAVDKYGLTSPIKQEFQLLLSQCLIKSINTEDRKRAIEVLYYEETNLDIDEYLKYRLDTRRISAYVHNGEYQKARTQSDKTVERLINLIKNTKSPTCEYFLNIIFRKYCNVHPYESSIAFINKSIQFFSSNYKYAKETYIALNNALALNLVNGNIQDANININSINDLKEKHFSIRFPRAEILENNILLYNLLHNVNKRKDELLECFKRLYHTTEGLADHIFIASNYSITLAINGQINMAVKILEEQLETLNNTTDMEGVYRYRILSNLAVCMFIENNTNRQKSLSMLSSITLTKSDMHYYERNAELQLMIETMTKVDVCKSANEWIRAYQQEVDTPKNYYCLYQYGFVFTTLFDWDDE